MKIATVLAVIGSCLLGAESTGIHLDHTQIITGQSADRITYVLGLHLKPGCNWLPDRLFFSSKKEVEKRIQTGLHHGCGEPAVEVIVTKSGVNGYKLPAPHVGQIAPIVSIASDILQISAPYKWHTLFHEVQYSIKSDQPLSVNMMPVGGTTLEKLLAANMARAAALQPSFSWDLDDEAISIQTKEPNYLGLNMNMYVEGDDVKVYNLTVHFRMNPVA